MAEQEAGAARVLLLACAGEARQRLEHALEQAGAELLRTVDPNEGDPAEAVALGPGAVLVALEAAIEDALERYDALLTDPDVLVIFDEAEVAAHRDGWDAARWARHLAAKLNGHQDVLPPGAGVEARAEYGDAMHPTSGAPPRFDFDPSGLDIGALADADTPSAASVGGFDGLVAAEDMDWSSSGTPENAMDNDWELAALPVGPAPAQDEGTSHAAEVHDARSAPVDPLPLGSKLSLVDDDAPIVTRDDRTGPGLVAIDFDAIAARVDGLSLADPDSYGHGTVRGAVVVEAGLGGPDAVRQLLGGLGETFVRAVLVRLKLDGGRYDRLVQQMQRATPLPVALAEAGASADAGTVYFLPPGIVAIKHHARLAFAETDTDAEDCYGSLPAGDTALVFLSGADAARVDRAMDLAAAGALVLAQAPDTCYDAAAVDALVARGAVSAEPGNLAQALLDHWSS